MPQNTTTAQAPPDTITIKLIIRRGLETFGDAIKSAPSLPLSTVVPFLSLHHPSLSFRTVYGQALYIPEGGGGVERGRSPFMRWLLEGKKKEALFMGRGIKSGLGGGREGGLGVKPTGPAF